MASFSSRKIRVGLIGLNAPYTGTPTGTNWAANAHLPYLKASSKYELVALQNSSAERAAKSIKAYGLNPETVKAYGTPEDLANDPNVDLVVCSIRVDRHGASLIPSIKSGKDVYVEWPIEANYSLAKELTNLVKTHQVRNVVALQSSFAPVVKKVKSIIERGDIGKVESSTMIANNRGGPVISSQVDYFVDRKIGGNTFTIGFGHSLEFIREVLGEISSHKSLLVNQYPTVAIVDPITKAVIDPVRPNNVPNQVVFTAVLTSGAVFTFKMQNAAAPKPGTKPRTDQAEAQGRFPNFDWRIFGTKGELRISSPESWALNAGATNVKLEISTVDEGGVREVDVETDELDNLPESARNIARVYEAFAAGLDDQGAKTEWYPDFEYGLKRHELIEQLYKENGF